MISIFCRGSLIKPVARFHALYCENQRNKSGEIQFPSCVPERYGLNLVDIRLPLYELITDGLLLAS